MKKILVVSLLLLSALCVLPSAFGQAGGISQPIVANKYTYAGVPMTGTGTIWTTAQSSLNYQNAIVYWVATGSPNSCTLQVLGGPTVALATALVDDTNQTITCTTSGQKVVSGLNNYLNINVYALQATKTVTVYVTLTNFAGNALNQTLSTVTQGSAGAFYWPVQPGNGTNPEKHILDGVGAQGAGILQMAELFTLSAAVASATHAQVVAAPGTGSVYLAGLLVESSTASTGSLTVQYGTGTNCGSGTTVLLGPVLLPPVGFLRLGILLPAQKALCLVTDASSTSVRALTQ